MNLFFCFTPYHLLMALIFLGRNDKDEIVLIDQFDKLRSWEYCPSKKGKKLFYNYSYINTKISSKIMKIMMLNEYLCGFSHSGITRTYKRFLNRRFDTIYTFTDHPPEIQLLLKKISSRRVVYIEDGSAPYNSNYFSVSLIKKLLYKLFYGNYYQFNKIIGVSKYIDKGIFTFPDEIQNENKIKPFEQFYVKKDYLKILGNMVTYLGDVSGNEHDSALFILPHSFYLKKDKELMLHFKNEITKQKNLGRQILYKSHPIDTDLKFMEDDLGTILNNSLPAELIPLIYPGIKIVVGNYSTTLLAMKFIFLDRYKILCIVNKDNVLDKKYLNVLKNIEIDFF